MIYHVHYYPRLAPGPLSIGAGSGSFGAEFNSRDEAKAAILEDMARRLDLDLDLVKDVELAWRRYRTTEGRSYKEFPAP